MIFLKPNWSEQFIYGDASPGFFVGREDEKRSLKSILRHTDSSSILISSVRGVGKTSFIHKSLNELNIEKKNSVIPVFINIGNVLSKSKEEQKDGLLSALIEGIYWSNKFSKTEELEEIYQCSIGDFEFNKGNSNKQEDQKNTSFEFISKLKDFGPSLFGVFAIALGVAVPNIWVRILITILGSSVLFLSFSVSKKTIKEIFTRKKFSINNSSSYLQIKFEQWLKKQSISKKRKIVFVIDELDKIKEEDSFQLIKEYKNLFTLSLTHFIFVASEKAYELVSNSRVGDLTTAIFPTLFTHVFYLPLPKSSELKDFMNEIVLKNNEIEEATKEKIFNYLLFRSGNDFFQLRRNIQDLCSHDSKGSPFLDLGLIEDNDDNYSDVAKLFHYLEKYHLSRVLKRLKKQWKENSNIQTTIFAFLNKYFLNDFSSRALLDSEDKPIEILDDLIDFLIGIGVLRRTGSEQIDINFQWQKNKYLRSDQAPLLSGDKELIKNMKKLILYANDLDEIVEKRHNKSFGDYNEVYSDGDGEELSGVNLYGTFSKYEKLYNKIQNPLDRVLISISDVTDARNEIIQKNQEIENKYFESLNSIFSKVLREDCSSNYQGSPINELFTSCPNLINATSSVDRNIYYKKDNTRAVLVLKGFEDYGSINSGLESLIQHKHLLVINIHKGEQYRQEPITITVEKKDKIGRKRQKKVIVDNFINVQFSNDYREMIEIINTIPSFLEKE